MPSIPTLLTADSETIAVVDDFLNFKWKRSMTTPHSFSMDMPATSAVARMITPGMLLLSPDEPPTAYIAEQLDVLIEGASGTLSVSGRSLDGAFGKPGRIVLPPVGESHDVYEAVAAETVIKALVSKNAGPLAASVRQLPDFSIAADAARGGLVTVYGRYQPLVELLADIALSQGLGWEIHYDTTTRAHIFDVIEGNDVSAQVIFTTELDALKSVEWIRTQADYASFAYVAGSGDGVARVIVPRYDPSGGEPAGLARRETFLDNSDMSDTAALQQAGDAYLAEAGEQASYKIELPHPGPYIYREDWDLGDIVRIRATIWGLDTLARIVTVESEISDTSLIPTRSVEVGKAMPTINRRISSAIAQINTRE